MLIRQGEIRFMYRLGLGHGLIIERARARSAVERARAKCWTK